MHCSCADGRLRARAWSKECGCWRRRTGRRRVAKRSILLENLLLGGDPAIHSIGQIGCAECTGIHGNVIQSRINKIKIQIQSLGAGHFIRVPSNISQNIDKLSWRKQESVHTTTSTVYNKERQEVGSKSLDTVKSIGLRPSTHGIQLSMQLFVRFIDPKKDARTGRRRVLPILEFVLVRPWWRLEGVRAVAISYGMRRRCNRYRDVRIFHRATVDTIRDEPWSCESKKQDVEESGEVEADSREAGSCKWQVY